tara:strand:+ start:985 stop:1479 length:495 start_codon:yes stop_codon:yes gene_type:complete
MNNSKCPVPKEQQPTNEFLELSNSMVFSWPKSNKRLAIVLFSIWILTFLIFIFISSGSVYFEKSYIKYVLISFFSSLTIPLLVILRLYLGWNHIYKRLTSEKVEYEESGWYDGQTWIKPIALKEKESLIATLEVKPILKNLVQIAAIILSLLLFGILFFQYAKY